MRVTMYLLITCFSLGTGFSQSLSPSVIALAGGYEKTPSGVSVSWTLGEPIVDPLREGNVILTQGFQQPDLKVITGFEDPTFGHSLQVFPNPTNSDLMLETDFQESLDFRLLDINGKIIIEGKLREKKAISLSTLPQGVYALYFTSDGKMIRSELIQKL